MSSDTELLDAWVVQSDRDAGNQLITRYFGRIRRFFASKVNPTEVEDLVQRTFAGCVEHVGQFRADASFTTYIFAIARRQLYRHLRENSRRTRLHDRDIGLSSIRTLGQSPSSVVARAESAQLVLRALQSIPVEAQMLIELHYWERMKGPEIATVLDIQPGAVRTRLHRARNSLRTALLGLIGSGPERVDVGDAARALGVRI